MFEELKPEPIHIGYLALCIDAITEWNHPHLGDASPLIDGRYSLVWSWPGFQRGHDNKPAAGLIQALSRQARSYSAQGLEISAKDCFWLISHLRAETLTVICN
jgi:hypothetical protein